MLLNAGGSGTSNYSPPRSFASAPSSSPTRSGQYTSGGGAPRSVSSATPGRVQRPGNPERSPARAPKKKPKPKIPGINKFLAGDETFQGQKSALMKEMEKFRADNLANRNNVTLDFNTALKRLAEQRDLDLGNLESDYAARGLLNSGLYTDAVSKYNTDWESQKSDLSLDQQRSLSELVAALSGYQTENSSSLAAARADAIRRRAQQYGLTG